MASSIFQRLDEALDSLGGSRKRPREDEPDLSSSSPPTKHHHRTTLIRPHDQADLHARLHSFTALDWSPFRPNAINSIACSTKGWTVASRDVLTCTSCHAKLNYPQAVPFEHQETCAELFAAQLVSSHGQDCPWRKLSCPSSLLCYSPPVSLHGVRREVEAYQLRARRLALIEGSVSIDKEALLTTLTSFLNPKPHEASGSLDDDPPSPKHLSLFASLSNPEVLALLHWDLEPCACSDKDLSNLLAAAASTGRPKINRKALAFVCSCCKSRLHVSSFKRDALSLSQAPPPGRMTTHAVDTTIAGGSFVQPSSSVLGGIGAFGRGASGAFDRSTLPVPIPPAPPAPLAPIVEPSIEAKVYNHSKGADVEYHGYIEKQEAHLRVFDPLSHESWCPWTFMETEGSRLNHPIIRPPGWIWLLDQVLSGDGMGEQNDDGQSKARELEERVNSAIGGLRQTRVKGLE